MIARQIPFLCKKKQFWFCLLLRCFKIIHSEVFQTGQNVQNSSTHIKNMFPKIKKQGSSHFQRWSQYLPKEFVLAFFRGKQKVLFSPSIWITKISYLMNTAMVRWWLKPRRVWAMFSKSIIIVVLITFYTVLQNQYTHRHYIIQYTTAPGH